MKNAYFVQVDVSACSGTQNAYLPYTAGILVASAWQSEIVKSNFSFKEFIFLREDIDSVIAKMDNPAVVGFSNYCWNTEYNKLLASAVKEKFPKCITVFGGHNIPDNDVYLRKYSYIDILCHGEGEDTTMLLFEAIANGCDFSGVPNITYRKDGEYIRTETKLQTTLDYPSPYLGGWFDDIIREHPEITFNAILETSRGCPNKCAYCDWGLLKAKTRLFSMDRVKAEIKWMADNKIAFVWGADANFGMFSRDLEIADELVKSKETTGYPERMRMNYAKNNFENVFAIVKKFKECDFDRIGATLSFQSMNPTVLKNIGRTNAELEFYKDLLTKYNKENMKAYSELILGLPGETYESFIRGVGILFEIGQHFVFDVYSCILLPNSDMGQMEYVKEFGIKTVKAELLRPHFANESFDVTEYNSIVIETNTMSREMWIRSTVFYCFVKAFHGHGIMRAFAIYLHYEMNIPYERFYDGMIDYFENNLDLAISKLYLIVKKHAEDMSLGRKHFKLMFGPTGDMVWDVHEYIALNILENRDAFFNEMMPYLNTFGFNDDILSNLVDYQKSILRVPVEEEAVVCLDYDINGFMQDVYINKIHSLEKKHHTLIMRDSDVMPDWGKFGKYVIWYGRMGWKSYKDKIIEK